MTVSQEKGMVDLEVVENREDILYTVKEVSKIIKSNPAYVYSLIDAGLLPVLKLGSYKIRRESLLDFLEKYEGHDLTNPKDVVFLENHNK